MRYEKNAFTLMEVMLVVIIIAVLASFAIPNYSKAVQKTRERNAIVQLQTFHTAAEIYKSQHTEKYYDEGGGTNDLSLLNSVFNMNLIADKTTFYYLTPDDNLSYTAEIAGVSDNPFIIRIVSDPISVGNANPCCVRDCVTNIDVLPQCPD